MVTSPSALRSSCCPSRVPLDALTGAWRDHTHAGDAGAHRPGTYGLRIRELPISQRGKQTGEAQCMLRRGPAASTFMRGFFERPGRPGMVGALATHTAGPVPDGVPPSPLSGGWECPGMGNLSLNGDDTLTFHSEGGGGGGDSSGDGSLNPPGSGGGATSWWGRVAIRFSSICHLSAFLNPIRRATCPCGPPIRSPSYRPSQGSERRRSSPRRRTGPSVLSSSPR